MSSVILSMEKLSVMAGEVTLLDDISMEVHKGRTLGILGESGSGKSMTAWAVLGLLPKGVRVTEGKIIFAEKNLLSLSARQMNTMRGRRIAMIFQDPRSALNPVQTIGRQMDEVLRAHFSEPRTVRLERAGHFLNEVELPDSKRIFAAYPHQLSGGMLQRVLIGMALSLEPELLIADEPTTALDALIRLQIIELLEKIRKKNTMAMMVISHNLDVIARLADDALVMYGGRVAEYAPVKNIVDTPRHPYTQALLNTRPALQNAGKKLNSIQGMPPRAGAYMERCKFEPRCERAIPQCAVTVPPLLDMENGKVACFLYAENKNG